MIQWLLIAVTCHLRCLTEPLNNLAPKPARQYKLRIRLLTVNGYHQPLFSMRPAEDCGWSFYFERTDSCSRRLKLLAPRPKQLAERSEHLIHIAHWILGAVVY